MMTDKHIHLTGYLDVPEERLTEVLRALQEHIRLSRAEPGCASFRVSQDPACPTRLLVAEEFTTRASFEAHQTRASAWAEASKDIPRCYQIAETDA